MTVTDDEIREAIAEGMPWRTVARRLEVPRSRIYRVMNPDKYREYMKRSNQVQAKAKRAWAREHDRGACETCGGPMGVGTQRKGSRRCQACYTKASAERLATMIRLRGAGYSNVRIAAELDTSKTSVANTLSRAKRAGVTVPRSPHFKA